MYVCGRAVHVAVEQQLEVFFFPSRRIFSQRATTRSDKANWQMVCIMARNYLKPRLLVLLVLPRLLSPLCFGI